MSQLKKHIPGGSSTTPPELIQVQGEEYFEVEALLKQRSRGYFSVVSSQMARSWSIVMEHSYYST